MNLNDEVRSYWEQEACGTHPEAVGDKEKFSRQWFEEVEKYRYEKEPFIHSIAQFTRHRGKKMLEIGVGAGTDHLQWARAELDCFGVDLTDEGIETTRKRLELYGLTSNLQRIDAEVLPFEEDTFDLVYSWGVIHHSEYPENVIDEIHRVLKKGGIFIGMLYGRHSLLCFKIWIKYALLRGKPWKSLRDIAWDHIESVGTKTYTVSELRGLFSSFDDFEGFPITTAAEVTGSTKNIKRFIPSFLDFFPDQIRFNWIRRFIPSSWGFFIAIKAKK